MKLKTAFLLTLFLLFRPPLAESQNDQVWVGPTDTNTSIRWATKEDFDGSLVFCRGYFEQGAYSSGVWGWYVDYPGADHNFLVRLSELTKTRVRFDSEDKPVHVVVRLDSPLIFNCPVLFLEDVNTMELRESEINNLRRYLEKGGFVWVDDFWGLRGWDNWIRQIRKVLPQNSYPMFNIPRGHPILNQVYQIDEIPQVPNMGFWYSNNKQTSERGEESKEVNFVGIKDKNGRLLVVITHNTDIADTWEREAFDESGEYFFKFSFVGYAIGINIFIYALTH